MHRPLEHGVVVTHQVAMVGREDHHRVRADPPSWHREHNLEPVPSAMTMAEAEAPDKETGSGALEASSARYTCPMHPDVVRSEPGACPICAMTLQRIDASADHHG